VLLDIELLKMRFLKFRSKTNLQVAWWTIIKMGDYDVENEVRLVQYHLKRLGTEQANGTYTCTFGTFFNDREVEQLFESLVGSLKAAKRRGVVDFQGQMLLFPTHKDVVLTLLKPLGPNDPAPHAPKAAK
jgi:hypothetical protein